MKISAKPFADLRALLMHIPDKGAGHNLSNTLSSASLRIAKASAHSWIQMLPEGTPHSAALS
eukprot:36235-Chlamydomonas_euryale.AAC.3